MIQTLILAGVLTWYAGDYVGQPLRCGSVGGESGIYDTTHEWIAVDIDYLGWHCGDLVRVTVGDDIMMLPVRDSGPLGKYCVMDAGECVLIVGDLPEHVWRWGDALSVRGSVENVTAGLRQIGALDMCAEERQEVERDDTFRTRSTCCTMVARYDAVRCSADRGILRRVGNTGCDWMA